MLNYFLGITVLGGVVSQSLMDFGIILIFIHLIADIIQRKVTLKELFQPVGIEWAFLGFFLTAMLSLVVNGKDPIPWGERLMKFMWIPHIYLFIYAFKRIDFNYDKWIQFFSFAFFVPSVYTLISYLANYDFITQKELLANRAIGMLNSATYHAHASAIIFTFFSVIVAAKFNSLSKSLKTTSLLAILLMTISILVTFTKGIWISLFFCFLVFQFAPFRKFNRVLIGGFLILAVAIATTAPLLSNRVAKDPRRVNVMSVHWEMFKEHPLLGIGYWDSYRQIGDYWPKLNLPADYFTSHAHNQILNTMATTGAIGTLFLLWFWIFFVFKSYPGKNSALWPCWLANIQFLVASLTDVDFEYAKIRTLIILVWALTIVVTRQNKREVSFI